MKHCGLSRARSRDTCSILEERGIYQSLQNSLCIPECVKHSRTYRLFQRMRYVVDLWINRDLVVPTGNVWIILEPLAHSGFCRLLWDTWCTPECTDHSRTCDISCSGKCRSVQRMWHDLKKYRLFMKMRSTLECPEHCRTLWNIVASRDHFRTCGTFWKAQIISGGPSWLWLQSWQSMKSVLEQYAFWSMPCALECTDHSRTLSAI